jgi:hypothetical protein
MTQRGGLTAIDGAIALIAILLIIQMWLLTATLEAHLAGHPEPILPAFLMSGILFAACGGLFLFIRRIDVDVRSKRNTTEGDSDEGQAAL